MQCPLINAISIFTLIFLHFYMDEVLCYMDVIMCRKFCSSRYQDTRYLVKYIYATNIKILRHWRQFWNCCCCRAVATHYKLPARKHWSYLHSDIWISEVLSLMKLNIHCDHINCYKKVVIFQLFRHISGLYDT